MSSKLNILESKKLFKEFNYLMSDIEFKTEFGLEYSLNFEREIRKMLKEEPIIKQACKDKFGKLMDEDEPKNAANNPVNAADSAANNIVTSGSTGLVVFSGETAPENDFLILEGDEQKVKHLYRKIVLKTHPDKVNSDALHELYNKATTANKSRDIITLYSICNELGIKFNITDKEVATLRKKNKIIKNQGANFEKSHLWLWVHSKDDNQKKDIVKHFLLNNAPAVKDLFN